MPPHHLKNKHAAIGDSGRVDVIADSMEGSGGTNCKICQRHLVDSWSILRGLRFSSVRDRSLAPAISFGLVPVESGGGPSNTVLGVKAGGRYGLPRW
jgi:hypothetical protein